MALFSTTPIHHRPPTPLLHLHRRPPPFSLPISSLSIHASSSHHSSPPSKPLLKPSLAALAAAALLLANFHKPLRPLALAISTPETSTTPLDDSAAPLSDEDKERLLEDHLEAFPDDTKALRALMDLKIKAEKFSDAVSLIDRLIALDSDPVELRLLKAHLLCYDGDLDAARAGFEELIRADPFLVEAFHGLVMVAGKFSDAEVGALEMEAIMKRIEEAIRVCKKEKRKEELREFRLLVAQIRVMEGKYKEALEVYEQLVKEEPRDFRPYLCQGIIYSVLQKKGEAEKQFEKYRRLVPRGHPYAKYFDDNVIAMKVFGQIEENKREKAFGR